MPRRTRKQGPLSASTRGTRKLTPYHKEMILRSYYMHGTYEGVRQELGVQQLTVKRVVQECQLDPAFAHVRAQAFDAMNGKVAQVTDQIIDSIKPTELNTEYHKVYDGCGNLLRIVQEGPALRDKALAIGILVDKTTALARAKEQVTSQGVAGGQGLLMPSTIEDMRDLLASKVKSLRLLDVQFDNTDLGQQVGQALRKVGVVVQNDAQEEALGVGPAPFDG